MLGLSFLSFHALKFFVCSMALGLSHKGTRDTIDGSSYQQKCLKKIARNHYTTNQSKPLIISGGCQDNFRPQNIFKSLACTWMIDHNGDFLNLDGIENDGLSAQCLAVDLGSFNGNPFFGQLLERSKIIWTGAIAFKFYCIEKIDTMPFFVCFGYAQR